MLQWYLGHRRQNQMNAPFVFSKFATILKDKKQKNPNCTLNDKDIDILCNWYKELYLLWDGTFAAARTINPTEDGLALYCQFVNTAVHCHAKIGCSITHNVHLMRLHVWVQMKKIPGGLGEKMEDWVELQHQSGSRERRRFRTTRDSEVRDIARG